MKQSTYYYLLRRGVIGGGGGPGPTNTVPPVISGTAERGETLTSTTGTWTGTGTITFAYQWTRNGADISGATSSTYTLVADDDNADMVCKITATDDEGSRVKKSNTLGPVLGIPTALVDPVASGTPEVDEILSVTDGTWQGLQPITITYQWRRDTVDISGATSNTYTLVSADLNALVDCMVTATNSIRSTSVDSNDLGPIEAAPVVPSVPVISGVPTIAGTAKVGETLTATAASATGEPTPTTSWQWERSDNGTTGWASISGATSSTYTAVSADESKYLRVVQTETNTEGSDSANSAATAQVAAAFDYLLDDYSGAAAAYSLRLLDSTYSGNAIKVRRASDNTEQDIGFSNNELDTSSLESFCSGTDGFVTTWYDQSGNANNATQTTAARQPKIVSSGSTILENGKAAIDFATDYFSMNLVSSSTEATIVSVYKNNPSGSYKPIIAIGFGDGYALTTNNDKYNLFYRGVSDQLTTSNALVNTQGLIFAYTKSETNQTMYVNNTLYQNIIPPLMDTPTTSSRIGAYDNNNSPYTGIQQELIVYTSSELSNRSGIQTNINDYYSIY